MSSNFQHQIAFLNRLKDLVPAKDSLVYILADLLDTSTDSVYRRIRGETALTFEELRVICNTFNISFDSFTNIGAGNVTFDYTPMEHGEVSLKNYLTSLRDDLKILKESNKHQITYVCEDVPIFHLLYKFGLGYFKMVYWMKAILNLPSFEGIKFSIKTINPEYEKLSEELKTLSKEIYELYCAVPSIEIWTNRTIYGTLKQIEYFWESGLFKTDDDAIKIVDSLRKTVENIENQAKEGTKMVGNIKTPDEANNFNLYYSDIALTNNCALVEMDKTQVVYLGHFSFSTIKTTNLIYCEQTREWLNNIKRKSTLISVVGEKDRYKFFKGIYDNIDELAKLIERKALLSN